MTWLRPENASNVVLPGQGHLVRDFSRGIESFRSNVRVFSCVRKCLKNSVGFNLVEETMRESNASSRS